jgi:hypothetical protein
MDPISNNHVSVGEALEWGHFQNMGSYDKVVLSKYDPTFWKSPWPLVGFSIWKEAQGKQLNIKNWWFFEVHFWVA